ncbi:Josephin-domain-containing protein [Trametes polyzona]|nr:Josephin-domain-containing protein [Trametes polyzona]
MATINQLIPLIYHEKQQEGSMLCAQHALNSLLQGQYVSIMLSLWVLTPSNIAPQFTAPDLSEIARKLDETEHGYLEEGTGTNAPSTNMDDTGFFSVQVLEEALKVWNLTLVRWRSEAMRPYQDHPHTQMGFILNQSQHWYALRRFGHVSPNPALEADPGDSHWFNLNSFLSVPERISKLYLGMFLQQAEMEGYSIFAVVQRDPEAPLALPRTEADEIAASIPESAAGNFSSARPSASSSSAAYPLAGIEGFEDEDMELQAALQASLSGGAYVPPPIPFASAPRGQDFQSLTGFPRGGPSASASASATAPPAVRRDFVVVEDDDDDGDYIPDPPTRPAVAPAEPQDPVAASMARQRAIMERMQRTQEMALQEQYEEEVARFQATTGRARTGPSADEDDHDELFRRAIAESEAMAAQSQPIVIDDDDEQPAPPRQSAPAWHQHRVYDDEDAELQAALRASLETVPEGFRVPSPPPLNPPQPAPAPVQPTSSLSVPQPPPIQRQPSSDFETESEAESAEPAEPEQLSMEEIRRRRLARFGS